LANSVEIFVHMHSLFLFLQIIFTFWFLKNITAISANWAHENFIPGRFIVPEWTWPGRGTFVSIPGLSRAIRDIWSPYLVEDEDCRLPAKLAHQAG